MGAEKRTPIRETTGRQGGAGSQEGKHSVQAGNSASRASEPEQSKPNLSTTIRRPSPARSNTDLRTRSVRTLVGTKAVRDRTSIRVVLLAPGRSLATSATTAAGVGQPSNRTPLHVCEREDAAAAATRARIAPTADVAARPVTSLAGSNAVTEAARMGWLLATCARHHFRSSRLRPSGAANSFIRPSTGSSTSRSR